MFFGMLGVNGRPLTCQNMSKNTKTKKNKALIQHVTDNSPNWVYSDASKDVTRLQAVPSQIARTGFIVSASKLFLSPNITSASIILCIKTKDYLSFIQHPHTDTYICAAKGQCVFVCFIGCPLLEDLRSIKKLPVLSQFWNINYPRGHSIFLVLRTWKYIRTKSPSRDLQVPVNRNFITFLGQIKSRVWDASGGVHASTKKF